MVDPPVEKRLDAQRKADAGKLEVVWGDLENIKRAVPALLHDQQLDVRKAEDRFFGDNPSGVFNPGGKGILFTNGTGTGKTFNGLGVAKRFVRAGRGEILIVVPAGKVGDWMEDSGTVGLDASAIPDTSTAGQGVTIVNFEKFRMNEELLTREYDLVIVDEVHKLMSSRQGDITSALESFRIAAGVNDGGSMSRDVGAYRDPEWFALHRKTQKRIKSLQAEQKRINESLGDGSAQTAEDREGRKRIKEIDQTIARLKEEFSRTVEHWRGRHEEKGREIDGKTKTLFLSASPFAYHSSLEWAQGHVINWNHGHGDPGDPVRIGNSIQGAREQFFVSHLGYRIRYHKLTRPESAVDEALMERELAERMMAANAMSGRIIKLDHDYSRDFVLVDSKKGAEIDRGISVLRGMEDQEQNQYKQLPQAVRRKFDFGTQAQLMEAIKVPEAIRRAKEHIRMGRKVVVFHNYVNNAPAHPFRLNDLSPTATGDPGQQNAAAEQLRAEIKHFRANYPELVGLDLSDMANVIEAFRREFGENVAFFNGREKKGRDAMKDAFNDPDSGVDVFVAQVDAAQEGLSVHDTDGSRPRASINIGLPVKSVTVIQSEGRTYRVGLKSDAVYEYLALHTGMERRFFGELIAERSETVENLAMGNLSRNFRETLREGYLNSDFIEPNLDQGTGGVARDRRDVRISEFDKAKTYYFGRQQRNARTKAREGKDYFATPEPVGVKMVEWADTASGEHLLEPSAGHGAIGRFFPETTTNVFIEPSRELADEARIKIDGRLEVSKFEDLPLQNKFHAVVMNPPFGQGGKTAVDHLAKAVKHLRNGGRIVAIMPTGPAADKRIDQFFEADEHANIYLRQKIRMPAATFERAGTQAATQILVLDRVDDPVMAQARIGPPSDTDLTGTDDINGLFDRIEDMEVPGRLDIPEAQQLEPATLYESAEFNHTKTGNPVYVAKAKKRVDDWQTVKTVAKKHGGYYSKFNRDGAIPGLHFKTAEARDAFLREVHAVHPEARPDTNRDPEATDANIQQAEDEIAFAPRDHGTPREERVIGETIGDMTDNRTPFGKIRDWIAEVRQDDWLRFRKGVFDDQAVIREYEKRTYGENVKIDAARSGYKKALMSRNLASTMMYLLTKGTLRVRNGGVEPKPDSLSLLDVLNIVGKRRLLLWEGYVAAVRAKRLIKEGKENNFADDPEGTEDAMTAQQKIDTLLALKEKYPEFEEARKAYVQWNTDNLDFAEAAGSIDPDERKVWEKNDYVPFYRMSELADPDEKIKGPRKKRGLSGQDAGIKELRGGTGRVAVLENIYKNAEKLIDASFKNLAMQDITAMAKGSDGVIEPIPHKAVPFKVSIKEIRETLEKEEIDTSGMTDEDLNKMVNFWRMRAPNEADVVSVSIKGRQKYYRVKDPFLLKAILNMGPQELEFVYKILGAPKRLITAMITLAPPFQVRNFARDTIQAHFISDSPLRPGLDSLKGFYSAATQDESYYAIMAAGGSSGGYHRIKEKDLRRQLDRMLNVERGGLVSSVLDTPQKIVGALKASGRASEMGNRVGVYEAARREGWSIQESAFRAMDLTNFSMRGDSEAVRFVTSTVPFTNTRLQGLYKLKRTSKENPKRFWGHALVMVAGTLAYMFKNMDDERYWDLEGWDRDLYYHTWIGGQRYRFPKPFEVGALFSTVPERFTAAAFGPDDSGDFWKSMLQMGLSTFALNPTPQAVVPPIEQFGNRQFFGWRPIVGYYENMDLAEDQFSPWTSETMRQVAKSLPDSFPKVMRSPKRLEHIWRGYLGTLGMYALDMSDVAVRQAFDYPARPDFGMGSLPVLGDLKRTFMPDDDLRATKYLGEFYDLYRDLSLLQRRIKSAEDAEDFEKARKLRAGSVEMRKAAPDMQDTQTTLSRIRKERDETFYDPFMDPKKKAEKIRELNRRREKTVKSFMLPSPFGKDATN